MTAAFMASYNAVKWAWMKCNTKLVFMTKKLYLLFLPYILLTYPVVKTITILEDDGCPTMSVSICQDLKKQICCLSNMTSICQETSFTAPTKSIDVVFLGPPGAGKGTQVYFP